MVFYYILVFECFVLDVFFGGKGFGEMCVNLVFFVIVNVVFNVVGVECDSLLIILEKVFCGICVNGGVWL